MRPLALIVLMASVLLTACGATHTVRARDAAGTQPAAARCPASLPLRSSPGSPDALAPDHPVWTTFCVYHGGTSHAAAKRVYHGGPLDHALNSSLNQLPPGYVCAMWVGLPVVVVLTYSTSIRHVVVRIGGCSDLITSTGARRYLIGQAETRLAQFY